MKDSSIVSGASYPVNAHGFAVWSQMSQEGFIADQVVPLKMVPQSTGTAFNLDYKNDQLVLTRNGSREEASIINVERSAYTYDVFSIKRAYELNPDDLENLPPEFTQTERQIGIAATVRHCKLVYEKLVADVFMTAANWSNATASTAWASGGSTPISDLIAQADTFQQVYGRDVEDLIFDPTSWRYFSSHVQSLGKIPTIDFANIRMDNVLNVLRGSTLENVKRIHVGKASYTSSNPGQSSVTRARLWGTSRVWMGILNRDVNNNAIDSAVVAPHLPGQRDIITREFGKEEFDPNYRLIESKLKRGVTIADANMGRLFLTA